MAVEAEVVMAAAAVTAVAVAVAMVEGVVSTAAAAVGAAIAAAATGAAGIMVSRAWCLGRHIIAIRRWSSAADTEADMVILAIANL